MIPNREDILSLLKASKPNLIEQYPIRQIAIFGSVARGDATDNSDVDILVDIDPSIGLNFVTLADNLEKLVQWKVDLISRRSIKPMLWKQIKSELIYV